MSKPGMHLTPEQLVDAAEGGADALADRHLSGCARCRTQLAGLQATMASVAATGGAVPEPSPLFWDHFQRRVIESVAADRLGENAIVRFARSLRPAVAAQVMAAGLVAAMVLVASLRTDQLARACCLDAGERAPGRGRAPRRRRARNSCAIRWTMTRR